MRRLTPALLTLVMFGVVGLLVVAYIGKSLLAREETKPVIATRNVPMAVSDIEPGTLITEGHIGLGPVQNSQLKPDMLLVNRVIVGRVSRTKIRAAEPIRAGQLYQPGELPDLKITDGMRAVSISVDQMVGMVDGMVKPGNFVDVLFTVDSQTNADLQGGVTMRLFEGVKIIAINRSFTQSRVERGTNRVTLELTEAQANIVTLAESKGTLTLVFNPNGAGTGGLALSNSERVTLNEILGLEPPQAAPQPLLTEIYRGQSRRVQHFNKQGRLLDQAEISAPNRDSNQQVLPRSGDAGPAVQQPAVAPSPSANAQPNTLRDLSPTAVRNLFDRRQ